MSKLFFTFLLICIAKLCFTQNKDTVTIQDISNAMNEDYKAHHYTKLHKLRKFVHKPLQKYADGFLYSSLAYQNLIFRNYDSVAYYMKKMDNIEGFNPKKMLPEIEDLSLEAVDAIETITKKAQNTQAIFLNEAHHIPRHRYFMYQLLETLYTQGFRYLAVEAFDNRDTELINQQKYPLSNPMIAYSNEHFLGEMIRKALDLGYTLVPYEEDYGDPDSSFVDYNIQIANEQEQRDWTQTVHLKQRVFDKDPQAKVLLLGGYAHIIMKIMRRFMKNTVHQINLFF